MQASLQNRREAWNESYWKDKDFKILFLESLMQLNIGVAKSRFTVIFIENNN